MQRVLYSWTSPPRTWRLQTSLTSRGREGRLGGASGARRSNPRCGRFALYLHEDAGEACWGPKRWRESCCTPMVLMDESAENVVAADLRPGYRLGTRSGIGRLKVEAPMRSGPIVVLGVRAEDALQVAPAETRMWSRHSRRTVPTHRSANAFALGARTGAFTTAIPSVRNTSSKGPENLASRSRSRTCFSSRLPVIGRFRACWVTQAESGRLVVPATWTRLVESSMKNRTQSVFRKTVSTVKKSQANTPLPCARRNSLQVGPVRRGPGPRPARRRIRRSVLAPTRTPSLRSSPWILTHPHLGFSRPRRVTRSVVWESRAGRPGLRRR